MAREGFIPRLKFLDRNGHEIPDPQPLEIPAGFKIPETMAEQIRRVTRMHLSELAREQGMETFEESEDFDIDDDSFDPASPYEEVFDPVLGRAITAQEFRDNQDVYRQRYMEADQRAWQAWENSEALRGRRRPAEQSGREAPPSTPPDKKE